MTELKDFAGGSSAYAAALTLNPTYGPAYYGRRLLKLNTGDQAGACSDLKRSSALGYKDADSLIKRYCSN